MSLKYAKVKSSLLAHVRTVNLEAAERVYFHNLTRKPDQDIRSSLMRLQTQTKNCDFSSQLEIQL